MNNYGHYDIIGTDFLNVSIPESIILIAGFIALLVLIDFIQLFVRRYHLYQKIHKNGGLVTKYNTIVNYLLRLPNSELRSYNKSHISTKMKRDDGLIEFKIKPALKNQLYIQCKKNCYPTGYFKHSWLFNLNEKRQEDINKEIELLINSDQFEEWKPYTKTYHLKWPILVLLTCTITNIINLLFFIDYANSSLIYREFGLLGTILCQFFVLMILGAILASVIRRKERFTINKTAKYGLLSFLVLFVLTRLIMIVVIFIASR